MACFTRNGDDESFGRGSGRVSSLDISTQSGERFPRRIPRANLSETGPKKRDIYREDLKYKVARGGDGERETLSLLPPSWFLFSEFQSCVIRLVVRVSKFNDSKTRSNYRHVSFSAIRNSFPNDTFGRDSTSRVSFIAAVPSRKIFVNNEVVSEASNLL